MKKITMFIIASCPHCKRANQIIEELKQKRPEFNDIEFDIIDENVHPDIANTYDYYFVPSFFIDNTKLFEGVPSYDKIEEVLNSAL